MITKRDTEMLQDESWKPSCFGIRCQGPESQKHCRRGSLHSCELIYYFHHIACDVALIKNIKRVVYRVAKHYDFTLDRNIYSSLFTKNGREEK